MKEQIGTMQIDGWMNGHLHLSSHTSGPESSPAGSPTPVTQQQVIQHNTITTSSTAPNHRTDINPIH